MSRENPDQALLLLEQARSLETASNRRTFDTWRAEILSRTDRPDKACRIYRDLIASSSTDSGPQVALDAAETLLDNGHVDQAKRFLIQAHDLARSAQVRWIETQAKALLKAHY
jgi:hypothetical protein